MSKVAKLLICVCLVLLAAGSGEALEVCDFNVPSTGVGGPTCIGRYCGDYSGTCRSLCITLCEQQVNRDTGQPYCCGYMEAPDGTLNCITC